MGKTVYMCPFPCPLHEKHVTFQQTDGLICSALSSPQKRNVMFFIQVAILSTCRQYRSIFALSTVTPGSDSSASLLSNGKLTTIFDRLYLIFTWNTKNFCMWNVFHLGRCMPQVQLTLCRIIIDLYILGAQLNLCIMNVQFVNCKSLLMKVIQSLFNQFQFKNVFRLMKYFIGKFRFLFHVTQQERVKVKSHG